MDKVTLAKGEYRKYLKKNNPFIPQLLNEGWELQKGSHKVEDKKASEGKTKEKNILLKWLGF